MTIFDAPSGAATELDRYRGAVAPVTDVAAGRGRDPRRTLAKPLAC